MTSRKVVPASVEDVASLLSSSVISGRHDLGVALLVVGKCEVTGDFICVTTSEGMSVIIR